LPAPEVVADATSFPSEGRGEGHRPRAKRGRFQQSQKWNKRRSRGNRH
jgi:hypothetical protein